MDDADRILLMTVNPHESTAVLAAFKALTGAEPTVRQIDGRVYRDLGSLGGARVFHALSEMGSHSVGAALQAADKAIRALEPTMVIAVGIAFGIDDKKQHIGDILVSRQLLLYELQRLGADQIVLRGDKPHASARLINLFEGAAQTSWQGAPVRIGLMLSGEKLIDNIDYRNTLKKLGGEVIGGEMEGAGVYVASHDHKVDWIVVKAICDWADGQKGKNKKARQVKAATQAAGFVAQALSQVFRAGPAAARVTPGAEPAAAPAGAGSPHLERVGPWLEALTECLQTYRLMASTYLNYVLNKVPRLEPEFEQQRLELDHRVLQLTGKLQIYLPVEFRHVIVRLRKWLSCSWQPPRDVYYLLLEAGGEFPRAPVETAQAMVNELVDAYLEMAFEFMHGGIASARYQAVLQAHRLDADGLPQPPNALTQVARALLVEHEYVSSKGKSQALHEYGAYMQAARNG